ncbi:Rossmann-like and DUF2520 domain-containing protein [Maribacter sp. HTCC2170]|uniref:Rossmann-like and DUF2520 domain-containing protein n=1 Tax=Maribacter sp. (strain HTCC2170 / KCCM 42371) TaxID=313603 RepID=UPI0001E14E6F|nr:Rossmann-like and DUF2520 domain-containing protein [Maribacter sp. HTCC2170]EAR01145.2 hypothetical protein FB2170_10511 [Maribacter sp. HTCC2170]
MIGVTILGTGNVAKHLFNACLASTEISIIQVYGRNAESLSYFQEKAQTTGNILTLAPADIYIIAISDSAIAKISKELVHKKGVVAHTSGSTPMKALSKNNRRGVFYPLQTFTENRTLNFKEIPLCIEAEHESDRVLLTSFAKILSDNVYEINTKQRKGLHLAAVFANNFTNHMYHKAKEICDTNDVDFELLHTLINETAAKIKDMTPYEAQTGPGRRNDTKTVKKQLKKLKNKNHKKIYSLLSRSITKTYGKKL